MPQAKQSPTARISVQLSLDPAVWRKFRAWCIGQGKVASYEVEDFMRRQLKHEPAGLSTHLGKQASSQAAMAENAHDEGDESLD